MLRFEFGALGPLQVRVESAHLGLARPMRLLYASDLHLGHWWTSRVPQHLIVSARQARPDLILLGGDLVDRVAALPALGSVVEELCSIAPVHAIPGNHDERADLAAVRDAVVSAGGNWLPECPVETPLRIDARITQGQSLRILCAHSPAVFPVAAKAGYALVLAGHLHGGQCVLATRGGRQYPAAWFHRWHGLRFTSGDTTMFVSRGAADTFPFRFNCPREVILCEMV